MTKYFIMEILDYIFLLSLLSVGYGKVRHPQCNTGNEPPISLETTLTPYKTTFQLVLNTNREEYMINQTCYWRFMFGASYQEIRINFEEFRLKNSYNCFDEYLEIRFPKYLTNYKDKTMKFCGTSYPKQLKLTTNTDSYFDIVLHSNLHNIDFNITVSNGLIMTSKESELTVSDIPMYIYSPGYPNVYSKYVNMTWMLTANDLSRRIMFEFLWLKLEGGSCNFDFIEIKGDKTNFLTCGYKSRFLVAANDSSVKLMFESDGFSEFDGFVVKYYTVPYPNYKESCVRDGVKLTAIPFIPQMLTVTKTNDKYCRWIIEPDKNSTNHVIVFEIISYFTSQLKCDQRLYILDSFSTKMAADYYQKYIPSANITDIGGTISNCINKAVQYYRSMSSAITVRLIDSTEAYHSLIGNMTFSYYSVPRDVYSNKVLHIGYRPSYIWLLKPQYWSDEHEILVKAESGCIKIKLLDENMITLNDNIGNHLEIYDGDSKEAQDLVNGCDENRNGSFISGTQPYMFIRVKHPSTSFQLQPKLLEITSTVDECQGYVQKMVVPRSQGFIKIYNPKHSLPVPQNLVCHYEVSSTDADAVFSIQGRSNTVNSCNDNIDFYHSDHLFYSWCFTKDFSKLTTFNKIRFTLKTYNWFHDTIRYSVTVTEGIKPKVISPPEVPPGQCSGRLTLKPKVDQSYKITSPYYPQAYPSNLHCEWLIIAPGGYEISLILTSKMSCMDTLKLFKGRNAWIEFEVFDSCSNYDNDEVIVSNGGVFLVQFISDSFSYSDSDTGFEITYTLIKAESVADLQAAIREQTFTFDSSWEMSGTHLLRRFVKASGFYSNYRIVLYITEVDQNFCRTSSISFTNVIMDSEYYEKIHLCDTVRSYTTLYASQDEINMDIYVDKDYSNKPYTIIITYQLEKIPDCSSGRPLLLFAEEDFDTFTSPNYPGHYSNNQYCQWKILTSEDYVLYLEVVFSELGYSSNANYRDYVAIYDGGDRYSRLLGKFTGSTRVIYTSTSDVVFIEFYSDATETNTGFKIKYRKEKSRITSQTSDSKSNTVAIIAGCITAGIFTLVFCIVCGVCCKRKRANGNREHERARSSSVVYNSSNTVYVLSPVISNNTTTLPPPPYSDVALDNLGFTQSTQPQALAMNELPPPYSDLPSYEDSQQYEIPNSRSVSLNDTLNNTIESGISSYEQLGNTQEGVRSPQRHGSQDELHVYDNSDQLRGIDNPALSISTIV